MNSTFGSVGAEGSVNFWAGSPEPGESDDDVDVLATAAARGGVDAEAEEVQVDKAEMPEVWILDDPELPPRSPATAAVAMYLEADMEAGMSAAELLGLEGSEQETDAVARIQSIPRGKLARKELAEQKEAAVRIQAIQLCKMARAEHLARVTIPEVSMLGSHTTAKFTQFWIPDVIDQLVDEVLETMEVDAPALPVGISPTAERMSPAAELLGDLIDESVDKAVGGSDEGGDEGDRTLEHLLPPLTLDDIDLAESDERRENAEMVRNILLEMADGIERIMEKTRDYLSGTSHNAWGTDWQNTGMAAAEAADEAAAAEPDNKALAAAATAAHCKSRKGDAEYVTGNRHDTQWHGVGQRTGKRPKGWESDNVFDEDVGAAPMVTVRQVREHRINSIG